MWKHQYSWNAVRMPVIPPGTPALPTAPNPKSSCAPWPLSCLAHIQTSESLADPPFPINPGSRQCLTPTLATISSLVHWKTLSMAFLCLPEPPSARWPKGLWETQSQAATFLNVLPWPTRLGWMWSCPPLTSPHLSSLALHQGPATMASSLFLKAARHTQAYLRPFVLAVLMPWTLFFLVPASLAPLPPPSLYLKERTSLAILCQQYRPCPNPSTHRSALSCLCLWCFSPSIYWESCCLLYRLSLPAST